MATPQINISFDVAIVCALHDPELLMVLETGTNPWPQLEGDQGDPSNYYSTKFTTKAGKSLRVVAAAAGRMGMAASSVLATKMILKFRPSLVVMVGIAAGSNPKEQNFGDILAADKTFDYGAGKENSKDGRIIFRPDPEPISIQTQLLNKLRHSQDQTKINEIRAKWIGKNPTQQIPNSTCYPSEIYFSVLSDCPLRKSGKHMTALK